ncbi:MAG: hypothetical protein D6708_13920, partial [Candidatus Dadabacteria bacterium]
MKRALWLVAGVAALGVLGVWALGLPPVEQALLGWVQRRVEAAGGTLEVRELALDPWRLRARVAGVRAAVGGWTVELEEGEARLHPGRALLGGLRVSLRLVRP